MLKAIMFFENGEQILNDLNNIDIVPRIGELIHFRIDADINSSENNKEKRIFRVDDIEHFIQFATKKCAEYQHIYVHLVEQA